MRPSALVLTSGTPPNPQTFFVTERVLKVDVPVAGMSVEKKLELSAVELTTVHVPLTVVVSVRKLVGLAVVV